jgi:hypothetical protein
MSSEFVLSCSIILWKKTYQIHLKNEGDLDISEAPPPGQKILFPYDSPLRIVQFWLHKSSSGPYRFQDI